MVGSVQSVFLVQWVLLIRMFVLRLIHSYSLWYLLPSILITERRNSQIRFSVIFCLYRILESTRYVATKTVRLFRSSRAIHSTLVILLRSVFCLLDTYTVLSSRHINNGPKASCNHCRGKWKGEKKEGEPNIGGEFWEGRCREKVCLPYVESLDRVTESWDFKKGHCLTGYVTCKW